MSTRNAQLESLLFACDHVLQHGFCTTCWQSTAVLPLVGRKSWISVAGEIKISLACGKYVATTATQHPIPCHHLVDKF